ncbi:MAG: molybdopterin-dependent oxidoreductase, partial [Verrucomicrobiota bacterium]
DSIAGISSARCTNEENYLMQKFIRAVIGTNNVDCCARVCHSPTALGMQRSFGTGAATNSIEDIKKTNLILLIGANPIAGHPVTGAKIKQFAMKGNPMIIIDPREIELCKYAKYHLQLKPGTNIAVLNMMAYFIHEAGLVDWDFIKARCEDYESFFEQIAKVDVDELERICGVDKNLVKEAALLYAGVENAMEFHGLGVTEHSQGSKTIMLISNLAMMTGNIGRPGVGVNPLRGQNNVQGAADMGVQPHQGAGYFDVTVPEYQEHYARAYGTDVPTEIGLKIPQMFEAATAKKLKALWIMGEDVVQTDPNTHAVIEAMESLDLLVVQELFMTETAKYAHVVFPAASFLEKSGTFTNGERRIQRVNAVIDPIEGTKPDGQIVVDIMN